MNDRVSSRHLLVKANKNHNTKTEVNTTVVHRKKILQKVKCKTMQNTAAKYHDTQTNNVDHKTYSMEYITSICYTNLLTNSSLSDDAKKLLSPSHIDFYCMQLNGIIKEFPFKEIISFH